MRRRIQPGWRYSLAQLALRLLFGRKHHHISPWKKSGVAVCLMVVRRGKVLLAQRRGNIEHAGCWSAIGGYVELDTHESFAQGVTRETYEETGLRLPVSQFAASPDVVYISHDQPKIEEAASTATVGYYFVQAESDITRLMKTQEETGAFRWFTEAEVKAMRKSGLIPAPFTDLHQALDEAFRRIRAKRRFSPLKLKA